MSVTTGNAVELKSTLEQLRQGLQEAITQKASLEIVQKLQSQVDAIDMKMANRMSGGSFGKSVADELKQNESLSRLLHDKKGRCVINLDARQADQILGRKSIITAVTAGNVNGDPLAPVGVATSGVLQVERLPNIVAEARQQLKIRDVLYSRPTTMQVVDFVKVATPMSMASPVPEGSLKPENQISFTSASERVKLLATYLLASRQVLDDFGELLNFLKSSLGFYVDLAEEVGLLMGDGIGEDLHGLIPQSSTFNTSLLPSAAKGWQKLDVVATAIKQINAAKEIDPTFCVIHPNDAWDIRLAKDGFGRYLLGDPQTQVRPSIWGLGLVTTTSIAQGTFLVGSGNPAAAEIADRMDLTVELSSEDGDNFKRNLISVRAEKRLALIVKRNASFVYGSFVTSPA